jgi:hypothetical protein
MECGSDNIFQGFCRGLILPGASAPTIMGQRPANRRRKMETIKIIRELWDAQPTSERVFGVAFVFIAPVLFWGIWVITP